MTINCVWEHNGRDTLLYAVDFVGAYTRGETLEAAVRKMQAEICSYLKWCGKKAVTSMDIAIIEEKVSELAICDTDSDVLFESEKAPLTAEEYLEECISCYRDKYGVYTTVDNYIIYFIPNLVVVEMM